MFKSAYQDGDCVEIFSPAGKNPAVEWKLTNKVVRLYDKGVKGYALSVSGGATSKMQIPKAPKGLLGLRQRYLVVQVLTATSEDKPFSLELGLTDVGGTRRRLVLSSSFRALHCTPLHAQIPLVGLDSHRGSWANLSIDLAGLTLSCFRSDAFSTLDLLAIGPTCRIRKIFTMRGALDDGGRGGAGEGVTVPEPNEEEGCGQAPAEPLPLRMSFPPGVVPPPRNWVISPDTFRDRASRDVPPPSPSDRSFSSTTSMGKRRSARPVPSPRPSPLPRRVPPVSPAAAALAPGGELVVSAKNAQRSRRVQDKTAKPVPGTPGSGGISPASRLGSRSVLSGGSSNSALPATPSPLAMRSSSSSSVGRRRRISFSNGTPGPSTPDSGGGGGGGGGVVGDVVGGGVGAGSGGSGSRRVTAKATSRGATASTTPLGRTTGSHRSPLLGTSPSRQAAQALAAVTARRGDVAVEDIFYGRGAQKQRELPARQRASENAATEATIAAATAAIARRVSRDDVTDGGSPSGASTPSIMAELRQAKKVLDGAEGYGGVRKAPVVPTSSEDWSEAGSWNGGQDKYAPAWSFMDDRYGGDSRGNGTPPSTAKQRDPSLYLQARAYRPVAASPPTDVVTTTPGGPRRSPPLAIIAGVDHSRAASYADRVLHDNDQEMRALSPSVSPSLQLPSEVTLSGVGATLRGEQGGGGSSIVSATHFGASVCSSGSREHRTSPSISRPSSSAATIRAAAAASPASADLFSISAHYFHGEHRRKEGRDLPSEEEEEVATAAHLFTPPFSASRKGNPPRRGSPPHDANLRPGTVTSPMSARVDVLQALLTPPAATGGTLVASESSPASAGERGTREKYLPEAAVAGVTEVSGALDGPGGSYDDNGNTGDGADALERLLLRSSSSAAAVSKGRRVSADADVDADSGADAGATSAVSAVARRVASRQSENRDRGCKAGVEVDLRCGDCPRMPDNEETSSPSKPLRVSARRVDAAASGDEHAGTMRETTLLGTAEIGWTPAGRRSGGDGDSGSSDDSGSGGIGGYRNESGLFPASRGVAELPESPLPQRPLGGKRWRDIREGVGDQGEASGKNQSELEELERKEIALLDLEDSFHAEFGSVDLSQSPPQARAPLSGNRSTITPHGDPFANTTPSAISGAGGGTGAVSFADAPGRHRIGVRGATRSNRNDDTDADSVVFGSPKGVRDDDPREQPVARVPARSRGEVGAVSETARGREGGNGRGTPPQAQGGGDNDLYFDPVLNCYYDRAADKYYGLR